MNLVGPIRDGIVEAIKSLSVQLVDKTCMFLDQFLLFILVFIILANVMGYKDLNKYAGLSILTWLILKVVMV